MTISRATAKTNVAAVRVTKPYFLGPDAFGSLAIHNARARFSRARTESVAILQLHPHCANSMMNTAFRTEAVGTGVEVALPDRLHGHQHGVGR
jgi:hypothetical protein